ncbi:MAG: hypothetical protein AAGA91_10845 [Pseudomonadota bacterium]
MALTSGLRIGIVFFAVIALVAALYWLTLEEAPDPCQSVRQDVGAAVLADDSNDQDALVNRAILVQGDCEEPTKTQ